MDFEKIKDELVVTTARSGGAGGQHVNKVETKVVLKWSVELSEGVSDTEKALIQDKLANLINKEGWLVISYDRSRSQSANKEKAIQLLEARLQKALQKKPPRKRTRPPRAALEERKTEKRRRAALKESRRKPRLDG